MEGRKKKKTCLTFHIEGDNAGADFEAVGASVDEIVLTVASGTGILLFKIIITYASAHWPSSFHCLLVINSHSKSTLPCMRPLPIVRRIATLFGPTNVLSILPSASPRSHCPARTSITVPMPHHSGCRCQSPLSSGSGSINSACQNVP